MKRAFHPSEHFEGVRSSDLGRVAPRYAGEPVDFMLARLKKGLDSAGTLRILRRKECFVPRSQRRRTKSNYARRHLQ